MAVGKDDRLGMDIPGQKQLQAPRERLPARFVRIKHSGHAGRIPPEQIDLGPGQGRSQRGHDILNARAPEGDQVEIPLDQEGKTGLPDRLPCPGKPEEVVSLRVNRRLGGIHVFRLARAHDPAAEGDHMTVDVLDGDHQSPAEPVVMPSLPLSRPRNREAGLFDELRRDPFLVQKIEQVAPSLRGKADPERADRFRFNPPLPEILPGPLPRRRLERPHKVLGRKSVDPADLFPEGITILLFRAHAPLRDDNAHLPRQVADRLGKGQMVQLHEEGEDISSLAAAEAVEHLFVGTHRKGGGLLPVKGTEPKKILPRLLQGHILPDQRNDIGPSPDLLDLILGN